MRGDVLQKAFPRVSVCRCGWLHRRCQVYLDHLRLRRCWKCFVFLRQCRSFRVGKGLDSALLQKLIDTRKRRIGLDGRIPASLPISGLCHSSVVEKVRLILHQPRSCFVPEMLSPKTLALSKPGRGKGDSLYPVESGAWRKGIQSLACKDAKQEKKHRFALRY